MSCGLTLTLWPGNTFLVQIMGLRDYVSQLFINDATVTVTLKKLNAVNVTGTTWPKTMDYVAASDGIYRGVIPTTAELVVGKTYLYEVIATAHGSTAKWEGKLLATERPVGTTIAESIANTLVTDNLIIFN